MRSAAIAPITVLVLVLASCSSTTGRTQRAVVATSATFMHGGFGAGPALFSDDAGHVVEERRYEPFGAPIGAPDLAARDLNSLGKRTEVATGWSDHGARWMAPESARWLTPDPPVSAPDPKFMDAPWDLHPYQFVDQNPIAFWDPDGREPRPMDDVDRAVQRNLTRLHDFGTGSYFQALRVTTQGWKLVVADPSLRGGLRKGNDGVIFGENGAKALAQVASVTADGPIKRLMITGHGYEGVQTLMDITVWDDKTIHPGLLALAGKFTKDGVLVFGGCNVMGGDAKTRAETLDRMRYLSNTLHVEVRAGDLKNYGPEDRLTAGGTVSACRGDRCVSAFDEDGLDRAWKEQKK